MFQKLKEENQKLLDKNLSLEKEIEDLKFQVSASALIISEHESKIEMLKAENKNLLKQINNTSKSSTEINNRLPLVSNVRGEGRKSRVDESTLNLMKSLKNQGLSYSQIAKKLEEETKSQWSKSTVSSVQYEYNTAGQLTKMITGISRIDENIPETASVTSYEYDTLGHVSKVTDAMGKSSSYTNYADGKTRITDDRKNNKYVDEYGLFGLKERCIYGDINGERRRERQLYEYNDIGQLLRKEIYVNDELTDSAAYEYDGFGRLTKETMNGISNSYTYDLNSNVTGHSISGADSDTQSVTCEYDALNRITGISANSISRCSYEYDANGNMILKKHIRSNKPNYI